MSINDIVWERLTPDEKKAFPKCVKPESIRGICYNRLPNDRCGGGCECMKTAKEWGLRRDIAMSMKVIEDQLSILKKLMHADTWESIMKGN